MTSMSSPLPPVLTPKSKLGTPRSVKFDLPGRPSPTTELFENRLVSEQQFFTPKTVITPSPDVKQEIQNILNDVRSSESVYIAELRELQAYMNPYGNAHSVLESIKDVHRMIPDRMELLEDWCLDLEPQYLKYIKLYRYNSKDKQRFDYLLKRPFARLFYLCKKLKRLEAISGTNCGSRTVLKISNKARVKVNGELENADMSIFYFSKIKDFDSLQPVSSTLDTTLIIDRAYFKMALQHPLTEFEIDIEALILVDRQSRKPSGLALCSLEQPGRSLMFPLFRSGELSLQDDSPSHINLTCCPCQSKKYISLRSKDPEQISTWIWKLESIFGKSSSISPFMPSLTNGSLSLPLSPPSSSLSLSSQRNSFGLGISLTTAMSSSSSLDNNLMVLEHNPEQLEDDISSFHHHHHHHHPPPTLPPPPPPKSTESLASVSPESPKIPDDMLSTTFSLADELKDYLVDDDESPEDTKKDVDQQKLQQAKDVRKKIERELLEKEKIQRDQRRLNQQLEDEIVSMATPQSKLLHNDQSEMQPLLSNSTSSSSLESSESQQINHLRQMLRIPLDSEQLIGNQTIDKSQSVLSPEPPLIPLPVLTKLSSDNRKSLQTIISDRSSIQESILMSGKGDDLEEVELADQIIVTPDFENRELDLALTPTIPESTFVQDHSLSPTVSSDDDDDNSTFSSPDVSCKVDSSESTLQKKPSLVGIVSNSFKTISSKFKSKSKSIPEFEIIDPDNVPQYLKTPKVEADSPIMEKIIEEPEDDHKEEKEGNQKERASLVGSNVEQYSSCVDILNTPIPQITPELDLDPRKTPNFSKRKSVITDPLGTAVYAESNNSTVQSSSSGSNISIRSLRSKNSISSSSSSISSLRYRPSDDKDISVPATPSMPQSILKSSGSGVVIFRGMAKISQWKTDQWIAIAEKDIYIEVSVGGEGGCVTGSLKTESISEIELWLLPEHEVRKSTIHDVQIKQTNHITMFRLKDGDIADRFMGAVEAARIDVKNQPLLYAKKNDGKNPGPPSMNSSNSSLGSIQSAIADVENAREQLLNNSKCPLSPVVFLPPILSSKTKQKLSNGFCDVIPEESLPVITEVERQTAARLMLLNNLRCRLLERDPLSQWTKTSDLARLSVFSVPGTSQKSLMVRKIEDKVEPLLYEEALPVEAFSRIGKVGIGISYQVADDDERDLRYVIQMKAEKEAIYIYDLLKKDSTN